MYNEIDPFAAQWIRNLADAGHIAKGTVDERSIQDLQPSDVTGPGQRHFFAGIAGWSFSLRLAGVPDDFSVWTGSCPCQPFSCAGKGKGVEDERHLWPDFFRLIRACRPPIIFGEQVASPAGLAWWDLVCSDLEGEGYTCRAVDLCAASVGAPHIRQRLYWMAHTVHARRPEGWTGARVGQASGGGGVGELGDAGRASGIAEQFDEQRERLRRESGTEDGAGVGECGPASRIANVGHDDICINCGKNWDYCDCFLPGPFRSGTCIGSGGRLANTNSGEPSDGELQRSGRELQPSQDAVACSTHPWSSCSWLECTDGKARPVESGVKPLVDGLPDLLGYVRTETGGILSPLVAGGLARIARLRGYGNAIVPQVAAEFIRACLSMLST